MIRNESDYDILLYVSENGKGGSVHSGIIHPDETIEFKINKFNTIMIVAGNEYQTFQSPKGSKPEEQPSKNFAHHFCDTDENYSETINSSYQFMSPRNGKNKFMIMGAKSGYVHLVDVHQVLEEY